MKNLKIIMILITIVSLTGTLSNDIKTSNFNFDKELLNKNSVSIVYKNGSKKKKGKDYSLVQIKK